MQERALTRTVLFKSVTTSVVDSAILTFSVKCQNIILNKHQTYLTVTMIGNAAFSKSFHRKIHEYVNEVVTIHKNQNHKKYFLELYFSI